MLHLRRWESQRRKKELKALGQQLLKWPNQVKQSQQPLILSLLSLSSRSLVHDATLLFDVACSSLFSLRVLHVFFFPFTHLGAGQAKPMAQSAKEGAFSRFSHEFHNFMCSHVFDCSYPNAVNKLMSYLDKLVPDQTNVIKVLDDVAQIIGFRVDYELARAVAAECDVSTIVVVFREPWICPAKEGTSTQLEKTKMGSVEGCFFARLLPYS